MTSEYVTGKKRYCTGDTERKKNICEGCVYSHQTDEHKPCNTCFNPPGDWWASKPYSNWKPRVRVLAATQKELP